MGIASRHPTGLELGRMGRFSETVMLNERQKLNTFAQLGIELNLVQGLDILMERILTEARHFVNADAGSIYRCEGEWMKFSYTQNDTLQRRLPKGEKLIYSKFSLPIDEKSISGYVALTGNSLNIDDVYEIDPTLPYGFSSKFDQKSHYHTQSMLTVPMKNVNGGVIGVLQVINAKNDEGRVVPFSPEDEKIILLFAGIASVPLERAIMTRAMILRMIDMAKMRDPKETGMHVQRVGQYSIELYERWAVRRGLSRKEIDRNRDILSLAAMLHDVGKVGIPDSILKKAGPLDPSDYEIMKRHTVMGAQLFLGHDSDLDRASADIALNHHERWDGGGYPGHVDILTGTPLADRLLPNGRAQGKKEEETPLFARIVAITDVFDALSSPRVYKEAWSEQKVLDHFVAQRGAHFDPELTGLFLDSMDVMRKIQEEYRD